VTATPQVGVAQASSPYELGMLADPHVPCADIDLLGVEPGHALDWYGQMLLIRRTEEAVADMITAGEVACPCHLAIGQEACAVGVADALRPTDRCFGAHRSHGHYIALGGSLRAMFAEILGKSSGCSGGMGGSMHLAAPDVGLLGTVPIVGATIPMAVGAALAASLDASGAIAVSFFGDGATEQGVFHESMNLAATLRLPILFACEHNLFSSHLHISLRQPTDRLSRYADAHRIPSVTIDGNDVVAVARAAQDAVSCARSGGGPRFIEMVTYRWRGHVGPSEDIDVGVARNEQLQFWKRRDPIARLGRSLVGTGAASDDALGRIEHEILREIKEAQAFARSAPYPSPEDLQGWMWARADSE
jgi:TPP-dependent pyruvate/acetoin dehydrogenase alpha subunit